MSGIVGDVLFALRILRKSPSFTIAALLTLALGIGATTAIFTVVNSVLLRPLPYAEPDRLVGVWTSEAGHDEDKEPLSVPDYLDLVRDSRSLSQLVLMRTRSMSLTGGAGPMHATAATVTANFFETMGVAPVVGRGFEPADGQPGKADVVVLSHALWESRYGGDPSIVGRTITTDGGPRTVVGVAPSGFDFPDHPDLWAPLAFSAQERSEKARATRIMLAVGRLAPGQTARSAESELTNLAAQLAEQHPSSAGRGTPSMRVVPLKEQLVGDASRWVLMLAVAVLFVLVTSCANVANLLLARSAARHREMAIRAALGAPPRRLATQLIVESCVLALLGGALGLLLAVWGIEALVALHTEHLPRAAEVHPDWRVAVFTVALAFATGLTFGVVPALYAARTAPSEALKEGGRGTSGARAGSVRRLLLVAQVALAVVLLGGAGLLLRSLHALAQLAPGEAPASVLTARVRLPPIKYTDGARTTAFFDQLRTRLAHAPGVSAASIAWLLPLTQNHVEIGFSLDGQPERPGTATPQAEYSEVSPGFFDALGIPVVMGRVMGDEDRAGSPMVAVVSQSFARRYFSGGDPVGKRFQLHINDGLWVTIIGVVGDVRTSALDREPTPMMYLSSEQNPEQTMYVVLRTAGDARALVPVLTQEVHALDPDLPLAEVATVADLVNNSLDTRNFAMYLFGVFAAVALVIGAVGIYGLTSYFVAQRTREIGIRMALGATPANVVGDVLRFALTLTTVGLAIGVVATLALGSAMRSLVYGVPTHDPFTLAVVTCVLLGTACVAALIPARRASRVPPTLALRME